jgi:negative regulator of sigma E activity
MTYILAEVVVLSIISMRIAKYFGLDKWQVQVGLLVIAAVLYVTNVLLVKYYIERRAPWAASHEGVFPGIQMWELTAGLGVVPKWISLIGTLAITAVITAVVPWVIALFRIIALSI